MKKSALQFEVTFYFGISRPQVHVSYGRLKNELFSLALGYNQLVPENEDERKVCAAVFAP